MFYAPGLDKGGVATAFLGLALELERLGYEVKAMIPDRKTLSVVDSEIPRRFIGGVAFNHTITWNPLKRLLNLFNLITRWKFYFLFANKFKHDIFVVFSVPCNAHWVKYTKKPVIGWLHGIAPSFGTHLMAKVWKWDARRLFVRFKKVIAVSDKAADSWVKEGHSDEKPQVITNLLDIYRIRRLAEMSQSDIVRGSVPNVLYVGRVEKDKGVARAAQAFKRLKEEGLKFHWRIVGDGSYRQELQKLVATLGFNECVSFLGMKDNPWCYMKAADLTILPSYAEGLGLILWESIICGTPVLATKCGGPEYALDNGRIGMLVDNTDEDIYNGLKKILRDGCPNVPPSAIEFIESKIKAIKSDIKEVFANLG